MKNVAKKLLTEISTLDNSTHFVTLDYRSTLVEDAECKEFIDICFTEKSTSNVLGITLTVHFSLDKLLDHDAHLQKEKLNSILTEIRENANESIPLLIEGKYNQLAEKLGIWINQKKYNT
jgi:hypothetical protein